MILIPIDMPKNCLQCPMMETQMLTPGEGTMLCMLERAKEKKSRGMIYHKDRRPGWCGLKEVHPEVIRERNTHTSWSERTVYVEH